MIDLWTYWEGPKPLWVDVCLHSIQSNCTNGLRYHHVTPHNIRDFLPPQYFIPGLDKLKEPAHRADYFRSALLAHHGGFYFDADTIGIKSPAHLASNHDLVYCKWNNPPERVLNGYIYAQPGSELAKQWNCEAGRVVRKHVLGAKTNWTSMGEGVLTRLVQGNPSKTVRIPRSTFLPIDVDSRPQDLFSYTAQPDFIPEHSVCFGLNHSWMKHHHPDEMSMNVLEWRNCPCLFHRLLINTGEIRDGN